LSYSASVTVTSGQAYNWTTPGIGAFTFQSSASGYLTNSQNFTLTATTTAVELCLNPAQVQLDIRNSLTNVSIEVAATVTYTGVISGSLRWNGVTTFTHGGFGSYSFVATPDSRYTTGNLVFTISSSTTLIIIYVQPLPIPVTVVNCNTLQALGTTATVTVTQASYSTSLTVVSGGSASWSYPSYGSFTFQTVASGFTTSTVSQTVSTTTNGIQLCVSPATVQLDVRNAITNVSIEVAATITYSGVASGSLRWTGITTFQHGGFGSYSFTAVPDSRYSNGNLNIQITAQTSLIIIYVQPPPVPITVVECLTGIAISTTATVVITSGSYSSSVTVSPGSSVSWSYPFYGSFSFATSASQYDANVQSFSVSGSTTSIQTCVTLSNFCGDGICNGGETFSTCDDDCVALFMEFENADGSGPVNGPTVNYFLSAPRDQNADTGPNRNSVQATTTRTTGNGSNTVLEETYSYHILVYVEVVVNSFINFYWRANTSNIDPGLGTFRLRVHLSKLLGSTDFNYRFVNTWRPIDAEPAPYAPTDLNLHLFHPSGALDINNPTLLSGGFAIGKAIADSKQSGGPATMDISPGSANMVAVWNSKPPRSSVIAPSQNGRFLVDSGSYVVFYGKTSNAANGKQLGQVVMDEIFLTNPSQKNDHSSDLWYIAHFTVDQPAINQPSIVGQAKFKKASQNSNKDMIFDCEAYSYCSQFVVPFSDTGRRSVE